MENIGGRLREAGEEKTGGGSSKRVGSWRNREVWIPLSPPTELLKSF